MHWFLGLEILINFEFRSSQSFLVFISPLHLFHCHLFSIVRTKNIKIKNQINWPIHIFESIDIWNWNVSKQVSLQPTTDIDIDIDIDMVVLASCKLVDLYKLGSAVRVWLFSISISSLWLSVESILDTCPLNCPPTNVNYASTKFIYTLILPTYL